MSPPTTVIIELPEHGFVSAAHDDCVTLSKDAREALVFATEGEAAAFIDERAPRLAAWVGVVKFCRFQNPVCELEASRC